MKYIIILAYYLVSFDGTPDVHLRIYPQDFADIQTCEFMRAMIDEEANRAYGKIHYVVKCQGVDENE